MLSIVKFTLHHVVGEALGILSPVHIDLKLQNESSWQSDVVLGGGVGEGGAGSSDVLSIVKFRLHHGMVTALGILSPKHSGLKLQSDLQSTTWRNSRTVTR